jgi:hypothetical protein
MLSAPGRRVIRSAPAALEPGEARREPLRDRLLALVQPVGTAPPAGTVRRARRAGPAAVPAVGLLALAVVRGGEPGQRRRSARPPTTAPRTSRSNRAGPGPPGTAPTAVPTGRSTPRSTPTRASMGRNISPGLAGIGAPRRSRASQSGHSTGRRTSPTGRVMRVLGPRPARRADPRARPWLTFRRPTQPTGSRPARPPRPPRRRMGGRQPAGLDDRDP